MPQAQAAEDAQTADGERSEGLLGQAKAMRRPSRLEQFQAFDAQVREEGGQQFAVIPIMKGGGQEVLIDDESATVIMLFNYDAATDATDASLNELVQEPFEEAKKIFDRRINQYSTENLKEGFEALRKGPVTKRVYRNVIWQKVIWVMESSGFQLTSFPSVDDDQIFVRIRLAPDGDVIKELAERFKYRMPFNGGSYKKQGKLGEWYEGKVPPKNSEGHEVCALAPFRQSAQKQFKEFEEIDEIRLIMLQLSQWVKVEELIDQKIIVDLFPAANFGKVMELQTKWASMSRMFSVPDYANDDVIRGYYGEKIAFFFQWTTFYVRGLSWLALFGFLGYLDMIPGVPPSISKSARAMFFVVVSVWAAIFNQYFKNRMNRNRQKWGMDHCADILATRVDWDPMLEGTWKLSLRNSAIQIGCVLYLILFVQGIAAIAVMRKKAKEEETTDYSPILITILIKGGGWLYARTAAFWVSFQNHRTQDHFESALATNLVLVKLFIALFPFLDMAFLQTYSDPTCGPTLAAAAEKVYKGTWPQGADGTNLKWLDTSTFSYQSGAQTCIYGCFPQVCETIDGVMVCQTNCVADLESTLIVTFVSMVFVTIGLMLAPILLVRWEVHKEMKKVEQDPNKTYSWLQVQAKCHEIAPYEYYSWGGSHVEDFLEYTICFTILVCFGMMLPLIAIIGFVSSLIQYRLFAYRITNVTCRPFPEAMDGIGCWKNIHSFICKMAIVINVGLVVFVLPPIRDWKRIHRLTTFVFLEHAFLLMQVMVSLMINDETEDVKIITDINSDFSSSQMPKEQKAITGGGVENEIDLSMKD